jgi:hypothetical protein
MTPGRILLVERFLWLVGFAAIVVAVGAFDWRIGLFTAGLVLLGSTIDWKRP